MEFYSGLVVTIIVIIAIVGLPALVAAAVDWDDVSKRDMWKCLSEDCKGRLNFDQFLAFYKKKPESWELDTYTVSYRGKHTVAFQSYREWKRYRRWKKHLSKWQEEDEVERATRKLLREIQEDYMPAPPSIPPTVRKKNSEVTKDE